MALDMMRAGKDSQVVVALTKVKLVMFRPTSLLIDNNIVGYVDSLCRRLDNTSSSAYSGNPKLSLGSHAGSPLACRCG